jgi:hypothetical protein
VNILVACEESQAVTKEFRALGHEAYSCDIEPCSGGHPEWHIQGDVLPYLNDYWDLVVSFPPCTHLASSGAKHFAQKRADGRQQQGIDFFMAFTKLDCPWAIENPIGIMSKQYRKPDQIVQPWWFGDPFEKRTCLWLNNLPKLVATDEVQPEDRHVTKGGKSLPAWYNLPPSEDRGKLRSKTFPGIAKAMAEQWTHL